MSPPTCDAVLRSSPPSSPRSLLGNLISDKDLGHRIINELLQVATQSPACNSINFLCSVNLSWCLPPNPFWLLSFQLVGLVSRFILLCPGEKHGTTSDGRELSSRTECLSVRPRFTFNIELPRLLGFPGTRRGESASPHIQFHGHAWSPFLPSRSPACRARSD